jgi:hypothetical protein
VGIGFREARMSAKVYQFHRQRTEVEIAAQLQKRFAELEAEAARRDADPEIQFPCKTCRWATYSQCKNALVLGYAGGKSHWDSGYSSAKTDAALCGPEKALWEPRSLRQRVSPYSFPAIMIGLLLCEILFVVWMTR